MNNDTNTHTDFKFRCPTVHRFSRDGIERLSSVLAKAYSGNKKKYEWKALATVIAGTNDGRISGFWGECSWIHEDGQYDSGDVFFNIG